MRMVFLHGPAAAGKLTVGRALARLTGVPVFHNHLVVDALLELFPFGAPEFTRLRERFWLEAFTAAAGSDRSLIFTFTPEPTVAAGFAQRAAAAVTGLGGQVHFVALRVSPAEQERRINAPDRHRFNKLTSVDTLRRGRADRAGHDVDLPPADLVIDTEVTDPEDAAHAIRTAFALGTVDQPRGYASG